MCSVERLACYALGVVIVGLVVWRARGREITRDGMPIRKPPDTLPIIGNGLRFLQPRWRLFSWFEECERRFGYETLRLTVPTLPPGVLINDPKILDFIFRNEGVISKGHFVRRRSWELFGDGIVNAEGESWRVQRKAGFSFLNTANLRVLTQVALPHYLAGSIHKLSIRARGDEVVNLDYVFHEITTKLMGKMAYNMDMDAGDDFTRAFDVASGYIAERFQNPLWPVKEFILGARFRRSLKIIKRFGQQLVRKAVEDRKMGKMDHASVDDDAKLNQVSGSLIQSLLDSIADEKLVADAALTYLSAGRDTTGQSLSWAFHLLMKNPPVMAKVRDEVQQLLRSKKDVTSGPDLGLTVFTPGSMPYVMAVFYEALRFYPPIPFEMRQLYGDVTLPDGTFLPKTSVLVWCLWAMQRSKLTWGEDADEFRPERFLEEGKLISRPASEFPVFNGGPRTCLGKKMAESIAVQVIATMVWRFDFVPIDDKERKSKTSLTMPMDGGLPVHVKLRHVGTVSS